MQTDTNVYIYVGSLVVQCPTVNTSDLYTYMEEGEEEMARGPRMHHKPTHNILLLKCMYPSYQVHMLLYIHIHMHVHGRLCMWV